MRINKVEKLIINTTSPKLLMAFKKSHHHYSCSHHAYKIDRKNNEISILSDDLDKKVQSKYKNGLLDTSKFGGSVKSISKSALGKINIQAYIQINIGHLHNLITYKFKDIKPNKQLRYKLDLLVGRKYLGDYYDDNQLNNIIHSLKIFDSTVEWVASVKKKRHYGNPFGN